MQIPTALFRYRPLDDAVFERELDALRSSYLFAPRFADLNDPMEAFYKTGSPADSFLDALLKVQGKSVGDIYRLLQETVAQLAVISFASSVRDFPMWAYYASNFAGMCLEFDTSQLSTVSDFQRETLHQVTYSNRPLPAVGSIDLLTEKLQTVLTERLTYKRSEWRHEREWRYLTGKSGRRHYRDTALIRVFLGPRIAPVHKTRLCVLLEQRPVEILEGRVDGFDLRFQTIKPGRDPKSCERVGSGRFLSAEDFYDEKSIRAFLSVPFDRLIDECRRIASHPNMDRFSGIGLTEDQQALYIWTVYKLRSGRDVYERKYFDRGLREIAEPPK